MVFDDANDCSSDQSSVDSVGQSRKRRRNQSWVIANHHAEVDGVTSKLLLRCLHCLKTVSYTNYVSSPMISHLLRQHAITENSPARAENMDFANPRMNSYFQRTQSSLFSSEVWKRLTVDMIIECKLPLNFAQKPSFKRLLNYARHRTLPEIEMLNHPCTAVYDGILRRFDLKVEEVKRILKAQDWISYTTDVWTSPWEVSYLGITAHWIDCDWEEKNVLIAFSPIHGSHTGDNLATIFVDALQNLDLLGSVFAITTDNASHMLRMVEKVEKLIRQTDHSHAQACVHRMFCIGHVLNLAVQKILKAGTGIAPAENMIDMSIDSSRGKPVDKLRQSLVWIRSSHQNIERFRRCCLSLRLSEIGLDVDVNTRLESTCAMIQMALECSPALNQMMADGPEHMRLSETDWEFLKIASLILAPFDQFRKLYWRYQYATINMATLLYVSLKNSLSAIQDDLSNQNNPRNEGLTIGVTKAIAKLDEYFSETWNGTILATAVALDPRSKFVFWENADLQRQDIDAGKETVRLAWQDFRPSVTPSPTDSQKLFRQDVVHEDEFTYYITGKISPATVDFDMLQYWKVRQAVYPNLSKMARKHLAVRASSTPSRRSFWRAPLFVSNLRNEFEPTLFNRRILLRSMERLIHEYM